MDYLAQPEVGLTKGEANRLVQIYEEFVVKFHYDEVYIANIPLKNLHYLLPIAKATKDESKITSLLNEAKHLSQKDFKERVYDIKTEDKGERTYEYLIMKKCKETGGMVKVHNIPSEEIKYRFNLGDNTTDWCAI